MFWSHSWMAEWWMDKLRFASRNEWRFWVYPMHGMYTTRVSVNTLRCMGALEKWTSSDDGTEKKTFSLELSTLGINFYFQQGTTLFLSNVFSRRQKKIIFNLFTPMRCDHTCENELDIWTVLTSPSEFSLFPLFPSSWRQLVDLILCDLYNFPFLSHGRSGENALHQLYFFFKLVYCVCRARFKWINSTVSLQCGRDFSTVNFSFEHRHRKFGF